MFDPKKQYLGNFTPNDGTIDFYLRVNLLLKPEFTVLDWGGVEVRGWKMIVTLEKVYNLLKEK